MRGRTSRRAARWLVAVAAVVTLSAAGFIAHPQAALAASLDSPSGGHAVFFESQATQTEHETAAATVGAFLLERGITVGPHDYVRPAADTPISDGMTIEYAAAIPVTLISGSTRKEMLTIANSVGAFLEEQHVQLGRFDRVTPALADPIGANEQIRITRIAKWTSSQRRKFAPHTIHEIDFALKPGETKVVTKGRAGERLTMVRFTQTDGKLDKRIVVSRVVRRSQPRIVAEGVGTYAAFADFAKRGLQKTSYIAAGALDMVATAYTADCAGCSGYTASGYRAGRGIVAVDPRVIPLGTKLYIPGYGFAVAGDTGGAIRGDRIDLGFDSLSDAIQFGRRPVRVFRLK